MILHHFYKYSSGTPNKEEEQQQQQTEGWNHISFLFTQHLWRALYSNIKEDSESESISGLNTVKIHLLIGKCHQNLNWISQGLKRGLLTELFFKNNINSESVFEHRDSCTQKHIHKMLALRSMYIMFRDLWGEWKRLHVKAVTLAGHLSMARWARRRRLRATPAVSVMLSVLFLTHRNADLAVWHCFGLWSVGRCRTKHLS